MPRRVPRSVKLFNVKGIKDLPIKKGEESASPTEEVTLEALFDQIQKLPFELSEDSKATSIIEFDGRQLAIHVVDSTFEYISGHFRTITNGPLTRASSKSGGIEVLVEPPETVDLTYDTAVFVYFPQISLLALENNNLLPHEKAFQEYLNRFINIQAPFDMGIDRVNIFERPIDEGNSLDGVDIISKLNIKAKSSKAKDVSSKGFLQDIIRAYAAYDNGDLNFEIILRKETVRGGRQLLLTKSEVIEFWEKEGHLVESMDVNLGTKQWQPFGKAKYIRRFHVLKDGKLIDNGDLIRQIIGYIL